MDLENKISSDRISAIKSGKTIERDLLSVVIGEINRVGKHLGDDLVINIIKKMIKNAEICGNNFEIEILEKYLPKQLSEKELTEIIRKIKEDNKDIKIPELLKFLNNEHLGCFENKKAVELFKNN